MAIEGLGMLEMILIFIFVVVFFFLAAKRFR